MWVRCLLLAVGAAWPALACSCASYEPVKACQIYQRTSVIFRGRVIDTNHDPSAGSGQMTLYRFKVLEAFKGLPPNTKEVFIDPGSGTSCGRSFALDHDYLIYTSGSLMIPTARTLLDQEPYAPPKQIPAAWKAQA